MDPGNITHTVGGASIVNLGAMYSGGSLGTEGRNGREAGDPPGPHALTETESGRTYSYDDNGNMKTINGMACAWDFKDRLVRVENDVFRAHYIYDHSDRRVVSKVWNESIKKGTTSPPPPDKFTLYVNLLFEVRDHDQAIKFIWDDKTRVARDNGNARLLFKTHPGVEALFRLESLFFSSSSPQRI